MKFKIITTTDNQFLGYVFQDRFPILLGNSSFVPDKIIWVSDKNWRFSNSNYSIDAEKIT